MSSPNKLIFLCGKMGAGKSTQAQRLSQAHGTLLISEDAWLAAHFHSIQTFDDYLHYAQRIRPFIRDHVSQLLNAGVTVVMDFPANTVRQRQWFVQLANDVGAQHELVYVDKSDALCLSQIAQRRTEQPERAAFDTEAVFHQVTQYFEPPSADEKLNIVRVQA